MENSQITLLYQNDQLISVITSFKQQFNIESDCKISLKHRKKYRPLDTNIYIKDLSLESKCKIKIKLTQPNQPTNEYTNGQQILFDKTHSNNWEIGIILRSYNKKVLVKLLDQSTILLDKQSSQIAPFTT